MICIREETKFSPKKANLGSDLLREFYRLCGSPANPEGCRKLAGGSTPGTAAGDRPAPAGAAERQSANETCHTSPSLRRDLIGESFDLGRIWRQYGHPAFPGKSGNFNQVGSMVVELQGKR